MIELYDAARLVKRRDLSLPVTALLLLLCATAMASYAQLLHGRLQRVQADLQEMQNLVAHNAAAPSTPRVPLSELLRQAEQLEREASMDGQAVGPSIQPAGPGAGSAVDERDPAQPLRASQWLHRLGLLAQPDVSLQKVEVERSGAVRVEGVAAHADALNNFVQTWERQDELARLQPRSIEVKQERTPSQLLRFHLRATLAAPRT